ncbi:hypothetical protein B0T25DRAFT_584323 [Lasiosphaeria hispida]|uniref:Uncharacterized protein n=1 Tax=Lasiosphaeria hispida TaxID=260671 RepID=A0AAJ0M913_9PEZI|nr:hypothetical protein B0T25DRAFT_584323 [Lasiosphaeria hispida]
MYSLFGNGVVLRDGLSNLYVSPNETQYRLQTAFTLNTADGNVWAISFSAKTGQFLNTSLTVVFTLMFAWLWGLVAAATLYFVPHRFSRRRLVALVALRNSQDPWSAFISFAGFTSDSMGCVSCIGPRKKQQQRQPDMHLPNELRERARRLTSTWQDTLFGLFLVSLALAVVLTRIAMGIILPPSFQIGNVAPVNASILYYPKSSALQDQPPVYRAFRGDPSLRALSSVQISGRSLEDRVRVRHDPSVTRGTDPRKPMYGLTYEYNITGIELGLRHASDLVLAVSGACRTEYGWFSTASTNNTEVYNVFEEVNNTFNTSLASTFLKIQPITGFILARNQTRLSDQTSRGNVTYAVLATLSHRKSRTTNSDDPWYLTEPYPSFNGGSSNISNPAFQIRDGRPALSCWHHDTWTGGGESVNGGKNLPNLTRVAVPAVLRNILRLALLYPPPYTVGTNIGSSALASVISSPGSTKGVLDAADSSIFKDMERLILGGYITTLNIFSDAAMFTPNATGMVEANLFYDSTERLRLGGADDFVVSSPNIATFNLTSLIATGAVVLFLLSLKLILTVKLALHAPNKYAHVPSSDLDPHQEAERFNHDRWARFRAFSAIHLLRNTYEDGTGRPEDDWQCCDDLPAPSEEKELRLVRCHRGDKGCAGHIASDPELLLNIRAQSRASSGKRSRTDVNSYSISAVPHSSPFPAYDPAAGQFEFRPAEEVTSPQVSITSGTSNHNNNNSGGHNAGYSGFVASTSPHYSSGSYGSPGYNNNPEYFSPVQSSGSYFQQTPPLMSPYRDEEDTAMPSRNINSAPVLSTQNSSNSIPLVPMRRSTHPPTGLS